MTTKLQVAPKITKELQSRPALLSSGPVLFGSMVGKRWPRAHRLIVAVTAMLILSGCPSEAAEEPNARATSAYIAVIENLASRVTLDTEDPDDLPTLFVESFDPSGIPLEVQIEVVSYFEDDYDVRFIDDRDEAIDIDLPGVPVRTLSLLVGLGPLVADDIAGEDLLDVRGELYLDEDDIRAFRFTLSEGADDSWSVADPAERIDPEGFGTVE